MRIVSNLPSQVQQEVEFLRPMFEERSAKMGDLSEGDWGDRPVRRSNLVYLPCLSADLQNDMLMWLMNEAKGVERPLDALAIRMLAVNFASIHTTSIVSCIVAPQSARHFLSICM